MTGDEDEAQEVVAAHVILHRGVELLFGGLLLAHE